MNWTLWSKPAYHGSSLIKGLTGAFRTCNVDLKSFLESQEKKAQMITPKDISSKVNLSKVLTQAFVASDGDKELVSDLGNFWNEKLLYCGF